MDTLQIRLAKDQTLDDIATALADRIFENLVDSHKPRRAQKRFAFGLRRLVHRRLGEVIEAYRVCGDRERCHAASTRANIGGPWAATPLDSHQPILLLKDGVAAFTTRLAADIFDFYYPRSRTRKWLLLKPEFDQAVDDSLGPFLFENPHCDQCPRCVAQERITPWQNSSNQNIEV